MNKKNQLGKMNLNKKVMNIYIFEKFRMLFNEMSLFCFDVAKVNHFSHTTLIF